MPWTYDSRFPHPDQANALRPTAAGGTSLRLMLPLRSYPGETEAEQSTPFESIRTEVAALLHSLVTADEHLPTSDDVQHWRRIAPQLAAAEHARDLGQAQLDELVARQRRLRLEARDGLARQLLDLDGEIAAATEARDRAEEEVRVLVSMGRTDEQAIRSAIADAAQRCSGEVRSTFATRLVQARARLAAAVERIGPALDEVLALQELADLARVTTLLAQARGQVIGNIAEQLLSVPEPAADRPRPSPALTPEQQAEVAAELARVDAEAARLAAGEPEPPAPTPVDVVNSDTHQDQPPAEPVKRRARRFQTQGAVKAE